VTGAVSAYAVIAGLLLVRTLAGVISVQRLIRRSKALEGAELERLRGLSGQATIDIREANLLVPVTAGFVSPVVILPEAWRSMTTVALSAILRHEAAHVRRRDCAIALLSALVEAALWFNPAVWLAGSRVRWFAEMACDADAARAMDGEAYASALLSLAGRWKDARRPVYAITAGAETGVARRIRLLLDDVEGRTRPRHVLPVAAIALVVGMPLSAALRIGGAGTASSPFDRHSSHDVLHQLRHRH
jgi:beta-lactamase regulating signal transducer with metallopeptidase domain